MLPRLVKPIIGMFLCLAGALVTLFALQMRDPLVTFFMGFSVGVAYCVSLVLVKDLTI